MKTQFKWLFFCILFALVGAISWIASPRLLADGGDEPSVFEDLTALSTELAGLWGEGACVAESTSKYEEPVVSIACNAEYTAVERNRILDYLFKKGLLFRGESYNVKGTTGQYWYRFNKRMGNRTRSLYVRLHVMSQGQLWGAVKPPARMALYIDNLATADELTAWQTLGVPLTFGLKPQEGARELSQQIDEYKQEAWLALDLRQGSFTDSEQNASVREVIEQDLLTSYLQSAVEQTGDVWGFIVRDLNAITTTVASSRSLFHAMKAQEKSFVLLPQKYNRALTTTANVMEMNWRRVTYDMGQMCKKSPTKIWTYLRKKAVSGQIIVRLPASAKKCAYAMSRTIKRDGKIDFKPLSVIFGYLPSASVEKDTGQ